MSPIKKDKRNRYQWRFWLDTNKPDELLMCEELDALKKKRQYAATIRNALKLFFDLAQGKTDELRRQFPGIVADLETPQTAGITDLLAQQTAILERLAANGTNTPATPKQTAMGFFPSELPALPSMFTQDDEPTLNATNARANFAGSMGDLFGADDSELWE